MHTPGATYGGNLGHSVFSFISQSKKLYLWRV